MRRCHWAFAHAVLSPSATPARTRLPSSLTPSSALGQLKWPSSEALFPVTSECPLFAQSALALTRVSLLFLSLLPSPLTFQTLSAQGHDSSLLYPSAQNGARLRPGVQRVPNAQTHSQEWLTSTGCSPRAQHAAKHFSGVHLESRSRQPWEVALIIPYYGHSRTGSCLLSSRPEGTIHQLTGQTCPAVVF